MSISQVMTWSTIPLGTLIGGLIIERIQNVSLVYTAIGLLHFLIAVGFSVTSLGRSTPDLYQHAAVDK
jgi:hypothetical protein